MQRMGQGRKRVGPCDWRELGAGQPADKGNARKFDEKIQQFTEMSRP